MINHSHRIIIVSVSKEKSLKTTQHSLIGPLKLISTTSSLFGQNDNRRLIKLNDLGLERSDDNQRSSRIRKNG